MLVRYRFIQIVLCLCACFPLTVQAEDSRAAILVVGDSLSAGYGLDYEETWAALLQSRLDEKGYEYRVVNASISGKRRLPRALKVHQPEIVLIELGGNDGLRGISTEIMQANLEDMIVESSEAGARVILAGMLIPPNYGAEYTDDFAAVYPSLAEKYELPLIPFFMKNVALDDGMMQIDGIHPNAKAQPLLVENVWEALEPELLAN